MCIIGDKGYVSLKSCTNLLFAVQEQDLNTDLEVGVRLHRVKFMQELSKLHQSFQELKSPVSIDEECVSWELLALKAIEGALSSHTFLIGKQGASIGRNSASNDIVISESFVSRKHCEIKYKLSSTQFMLSDLGSTTGTFVMAREPLELNLDTMFQMGLSEFRVTSVKYTPFGSALNVELSIYEGPAKGKEIKIVHSGATIGRDPSNTICIREDSQMSSFHAEIAYKNNKYILNDIGSTNRTWRRISAEGEQSDSFPIVVGDLIKIGSTVLIAKLPDPEELSENSCDGEPVKEENACKICYCKEANVCCYPCGHLFCKECANKCSDCPTCRKRIQDRVKLYK